jgi:phosphoglycerate dehydrogenase-like enzyme
MLVAGRIAGVALDVLAEEPLSRATVSSRCRTRSSRRTSAARPST